MNITKPIHLFITLRSFAFFAFSFFWLQLCCVVLIYEIIWEISKKKDKVAADPGLIEAQMQLMVSQTLNRGLCKLA